MGRTYSLKIFQPCFREFFSNYQGIPSEVPLFEVYLSDDSKNELGAFVAHILENDGHFAIFGQRRLGINGGQDEGYGKRLLAIRDTKQEALLRLHELCRQEADRLIEENVLKGRTMEEIQLFTCKGSSKLYVRQGSGGREEDPVLHYYNPYWIE